MFTRLQMAMARFMQGRNGIDNISFHATWGGLILSILDMFLGTGVLGTLGLALYVYAIFRMFSRNVGKRQMENQKYIQLTEKVKRETKQFFLRLKGMKTYKYFRCPQCKVRIRLKRGSGVKHLTCPKCRCQFDQKA